MPGIAGCVEGQDFFPVLPGNEPGRRVGSPGRAARSGSGPARILRAVPPPALHVLLVARWYPSHDQPGRGTFVADLVEAVRGTGRVEVTVASFEPTHVRG